MLDIELLKQILMVSIASGCVTTLTIQKIKEQIKTKKYLFIISFIVSMVIGTLFSKAFSEATWIYSLWSGFFTWIDANLIYAALEDKIFAKYGDMEKTTHIERDDK